MTITLRIEKGAPLTIEELDENFSELEARLKALEEGEAITERIKEVIIEGNELVFKSTFDREIGRCLMPLPPFHARGVWERKKDYMYGDLVTLSGMAFMCLKNHKSESHFSEDSEKWRVFLKGLSFSDEQKPSESGEAHEKSGVLCASSTLFECGEQKLQNLPLYEKETLPSPQLGHIGILLDQKKPPCLIVGTERHWKIINLEKD